jgi:hypothetical protein
MADDNLDPNSTFHLTEEEKNTGKKLTKLFDSAKKWKYYYAGDKHKNWIDAIRWYKAMQWKQNRPKSKSSVFFNRLFSIIQKELPFMTDRPPTIRVLPEEPSDKIAADIFKRLIENAWIDRDMDLKIPEGVLHCKQLGTAFFRPFWNPELADGLGDVDCEVIDPFEVFPFAYSKRLVNYEGICWAKWVSKAWILTNYPEEGKRVKVGSKVSNDVPDRAKQTNSADPGEYAQVTDTQGVETHYLPSGGSNQDDSYKRILLRTYYMKDPTMKEADKKDDVENKKEKVQVAAYPHGRIIVEANGVILEDGAIEFKFSPLVELLNYINPSEFWGMSDIQQIKQGQKELNKLQAMIIDAVKRGVYTVKFVDAKSGIDVDDFMVHEDAVYNTNTTNPVSELRPQELPQQVFNFAQTIEGAIEKTAGVQDFNQNNTGDLPSGEALARYGEITQTRLRQKLRNLGYTIRHIGQAWLEIMLKNYTDQRIMRVINSNTGQAQYVFIFREEDKAIAEAMTQKIQAETIPGTEQKGPDGQPIPNSGQKKYQYVLNLADIKGGFDLRIEDSSTVAVSKQANFNQAFALYQKNAIDQQALLEAADFPNKEEILKRMSQMKQQGMIMQQQAIQKKQMQDQQKLQTTLKKQSMGDTTKKEIKVMDITGNVIKQGIEGHIKQRQDISEPQVGEI